MKLVAQHFKHEVHQCPCDDYFVHLASIMLAHVRVFAAWVTLGAANSHEKLVRFDAHTYSLSDA